MQISIANDERMIDVTKTVFHIMDDSDIEEDSMMDCTGTMDCESLSLSELCDIIVDGSAFLEDSNTEITGARVTRDMVNEQIVKPMNTMLKEDPTNCETLNNQRAQIARVVESTSNELTTLPTIVARQQCALKARACAKRVIDIMQKQISVLDSEIEENSVLYNKIDMNLKFATDRITPLGIMYNEIKSCNICYEHVRGKHFMLYDNCVHSHCGRCVVNIVKNTKIRDLKCPECCTPWTTIFRVIRCGSNFTIERCKFVPIFRRRRTALNE